MQNHMKLAWRRALPGALGIIVGIMMTYAVSVAPASGQAAAPAAPAAQKPQMSEDVFKNIQVLKGVPVDEFMDIMGFFAASLTLNCTDCHGEESGGDWAKYADDPPLKQTARKMILMVNAINKNNFAGVRDVTCFTCHRGDEIPKVIPRLALQYGEPASDDPNEVEIPAQAPEGTSVDQVLDKYIQAIGGAQRLASLTSFTAKGTYEGFDTGHQKDPVEIYAKAPGLRTTIVQLAPKETSTRTYDGRAGWIASSDKPVPLMAVTGGELDGAKIDAILSFPARLKQTFAPWRVGSATIDDHDVAVVQGTGAGRSPIKLYFDAKSGLLVRQVRYAKSAVGTNPIQVDYSDYRDVAGVMMPFHWTVTWTDGQSTTDLTDVQPNAAIDAAKFAKPAPATLE